MDQLSDIVRMVAATVRPLAKEENPLALAHLEHFISQGFSLKFDRIQEKLIPWIKKFRALRANAIWREATYITIADTTYNLLTDFTKVLESIICSQALKEPSPRAC
jgi:hypothetical protein